MMAAFIIVNMLVSCLAVSANDKEGCRGRFPYNHINEHKLGARNSIGRLSHAASETEKQKEVREQEKVHMQVLLKRLMARSAAIRSHLSTNVRHEHHKLSDIQVLRYSNQ